MDCEKVMMVNVVAAALNVKCDGFRERVGRRCIETTTTINTQSLLIPFRKL